ncbi:class I SAM-dependent methyltransferase [Candidatus Saccharibacteria bacterium]|nr:class I SAM-dependent methyltransferase [Candidatus Saccharibacteria bacterium]
MVKIDTSTEPRIVKYQDKNDVFVFADFWKGRDYDHHAEEIIIGKYFRKYFAKREAGSWLVDIGGSFGRLLPSYAPFFKEVAIFDYAASEFYRAVEIAEKEKMKLHLVAANAYHLPLSDNSQSCLIAVRLIHHLEDPLWFFEEIERVLKPGGTLICQAANKNHLKTLLQAIGRLDFSIWRLDWLDIGAKGVQEDGNFALIRNYNPAYLEKSLKELNLKIVRRRSTSWLRNVKLLQRIPGSMYLFERPLQWLSFLLPLGPSNWYVIQKIDQTEREEPADSKRAATNFLSTLCLPKSRKKISPSDRPKHLKKAERDVAFLDLRYPKN